MKNFLDKLDEMMYNNEYRDNFTTKYDIIRVDGEILMIKGGG